MYIDTHSHLYLDQFDEDRNEVLLRAFSCGVEKIILPNIDQSTSGPMLDLENQFPGQCIPLMGLHPTSVKANFREELKVVEQYLEKRDFAGIGEIGIDLYWDKTFYKEQVICFERQIEWAKERKIPIIIHSRESFDEIFPVVENMQDGNLTGVFHSFGGTVEQANFIIGLGFKIGINGIVTFKNSKLDKTLASIDLGHLVLETDAPFLAPVPFRGKRNESAYLVNIAKKLAEVYETGVEEVAGKTTANAKELFNLT